MNDSDVKKLWRLLGELYPRQKQMETENKLLAWTLTLAPYEYDAVKDAALAHARRNNYYPSIAELVALLPARKRSVAAEWTERIRQGVCKDAADYLGEISRAAREQGVSWEQARWESELSG